MSETPAERGAATGGDTEGQPDEGEQGNAPDYTGSQSGINDAKQKSYEDDRQRLADEQANS